MSSVFGVYLVSWGFIFFIVRYAFNPDSHVICTPFNVSEGIVMDDMISFFRKKREDQEALLENARKLVGVGRQAFAWLTREVVAITSTLTTYVASPTALLDARARQRPGLRRVEVAPT